MAQEEPTTRGTPEDARRFTEGTALRERNEAAARKAEKAGASDLEVEIARNRGIASPTEVRGEVREDLMENLNRQGAKAPVVLTPHGPKPAVVTKQIADRAIDAAFRTSFDNDQTEAQAIAVAAVAYKFANNGWFDSMREPETLDKKARNFSNERVAEFLQEHGVKATPEDISRITTEGRHIATGTESKHAKSNGPTR